MKNNNLLQINFDRNVSGLNKEDKNYSRIKEFCIKALSCPKQGTPEVEEYLNNTFNDYCQYIKYAKVDNKIAIRVNYGSKILIAKESDNKVQSYQTVVNGVETSFNDVDEMIEYLYDKLDGGVLSGSNDGIDFIIVA